MPQRYSRASWLATAGAVTAPLAFRGIALAQPLVELKLGAAAVEANAQIYYAQDEGFFKKAGLNVAITILRSGTTTMAAVIGGDLQGGIANLVSLGSAHVRGVPFVIFAPGALYDTKAPPSVCVVAPDSTIKDAKDLDGKTVGGISLGGLDQLALWAYIDKNGGDISTVKFVEVPDSSMAEALATGRIAAASMGEPQLTAMASRVKFLAKAWDAISPVFMQTAWFTTADWLGKNKDTARRISEALVAGGQWAMANPDAAPAVLEKYSKFRIPRAKMRYGEKLDPYLMQPVFDSGFKYKMIAGQVAATDMTWNGK